MPFYLGRPGRLVAMPAPLRGLDGSRQRPTTVHRGPDGARRVDFGSGRRTYQLSWPYLSPDLLSAVEVFAQGHAGPGPYALIDPARRNHLAVNQSSAGSALGDATGYAATVGAVDAQADVVYRGPNAVRWSIPATATSAVLSLTGPGGYPGVPVPAGEPWTWQCRVAGGGADPEVTVTAAHAWLRADGSLLTTIYGSSASTSSLWPQVSVTTLTPPSGGVYLVPQLHLDVASLAGGDSGLGDAPLSSRWVSLAGMSGGAGEPLADWFFGQGTYVYVDEPQLAMAATVQSWAAGTGVPLVSWTDLPDTYLLAGVHAVQATLLEVG